MKGVPLCLLARLFSPVCGPWHHSLGEGAGETPAVAGCPNGASNPTGSAAEVGGCGGCSARQGPASLLAFPCGCAGLGGCSPPLLSCWEEAAKERDMGAAQWGVKLGERSCLKHSWVWALQAFSSALLCRGERTLSLPGTFVATYW